MFIKAALGQKSFNDTLAAQLNTVYFDDQKYRGELDSIQNRFGGQSKEMKSVLAMMTKTDSLNEIKVRAILDRYGWLTKQRKFDRFQSSSTLLN